MNRGTVVFLALAILVAHMLAIHQTPDGTFAAPYEIAHVAYRLGRNLAYEGTAVWNPGGAPAESYPSVIWVLVSAGAARLYISPAFVTQALGLCCALATVFVLAQFSRMRTAGLIAPVLLAVCGSAAAAALSGTEAALAMLLASAAFLAFERGWGRVLSLVLALLVLTRPEGLAFTAALMLLEQAGRPRTEHARRPALRRAFVLPLGVAALVLILRRVFVGEWLSPFAAPLFELEPARWELGALYFLSFVTASGFGLLVLVVVLSMVLRRSSAMGTRALILVASWWGVVVLTGGDGLPFWNALVPVLPLFFLAVQECVSVWMDERPALARIAWPLLFVSIGGALFASKVPGDIGPLRLEEPLTRWQTPSGALAEAYPRPFARLGLLEEIRAVEHLRTLGLFLKDRVSADASILTFWPGAIGYLSRKEVLDLSGRAWPLPDKQRPLSWRGAERVDVLSSLASGADYLVPVIGSISDTDAPTDFVRTWLERYDKFGPTEERRRELIRLLGGNYELVSVPVASNSLDPKSEPSALPVRLLQRKDLELVPRLDLEPAGGELRVLARHEGHPIVVDLCVRLSEPDGSELYLRPTGSWTRRVLPADPPDARTSLLIYQTGTRAIVLAEAHLPADLHGGRVTAWLHNPGMPPDAPLSPVGQPVSGEL